jgi:hypothetical protein
MKDAASGGSVANGPKNNKKKNGNQSQSSHNQDETVDSSMSQTTQYEKEQGDERGSSGKYVLEWKDINFFVLA